MSSRALPIDQVIPQIVNAIDAGESVVLQAQPGAGKTTRVPLALMQLDCLAEGQIWVIQPRRLAARSVASYLAGLVGEAVGQRIGYHVRFDRQESKRTKLVFMTTGMFLRRLQSDPLLEQASCVVLDEFHERTMHLDLAVAMVQRLREHFRDDLKLVVMSATIDCGPVADFLGKPCSVIQCGGRHYPVEITHHEMNRSHPWESELARVIGLAIDQSTGHVLVFLPGVGEIERLQRFLSVQALTTEFVLYPLHGSLSAQQQDRVLRPNSPTRKLVLATNIAETSITIDGVTAVVDTGLARRPQMDWQSGISRLATVPISKASADQRAGRAGRTEPGVCHRMWSQAAHRNRESFDLPEILRSDLSEGLLLLATLGETEWGDLHWLVAPPPQALQTAEDLLQAIGAIDSNHKLTARGHLMAQLPLHPRVACFAIELAALSSTELAAQYAARLSETGQFVGQKTPSVTRAEKQIKRQLQSLSVIGSDALTDESESLGRAMIAAYADRITLARPDDPDRGLMVGSRGVIGLRKCSDPLQDPPLWVAHQVAMRPGDCVVYDAVPIRLEWLPQDQLEERLTVEFDQTARAVRARTQLCFRDLILKETPSKCEPDQSTRDCLFAAACQFPDEVKPDVKRGEPNDIETLLQRCRLVWSCTPSFQACLAKLDSGELYQNILWALCDQRLSFQDLRRAPWADFLMGEIGYEVYQQVQQQAPTHLQLPSGTNTRVVYETGQPPRIEAKIGECFGWQETPRICGSKVKLQLHLLGPNGRVQQITEDLASFWHNTYAEVRKELRRRYPKHHWPEDPLTATAVPGGFQRRRRT